jgi:hypothetical protein
MPDFVIAMLKPMMVVVPLGVLYCLTTIFYQKFKSNKNNRDKK